MNEPVLWRGYDEERAASAIRSDLDPYFMRWPDDDSIIAEGRAGLIESCGSCGALLFPLPGDGPGAHDVYPWHAADEDCRAVRV